MRPLKRRPGCRAAAPAAPGRDAAASRVLQVHRLRSVDNLFVVVQEFKDYPFKESKVSFFSFSDQLWVLEWVFNLRLVSESTLLYERGGFVLSVMLSPVLRAGLSVTCGRAVDRISAVARVAPLVSGESRHHAHRSHSGQ